MAQQLRMNSVDVITANLPKLQTMQTSLNFLLEKEVGQWYASLKHRNDQMRKSNDYAGELEALALAHHMKTQMFLYATATVAV